MDFEVICEFGLFRRVFLLHRFNAAKFDCCTVVAWKDDAQYPLLSCEV